MGFFVPPTLLLLLHLRIEGDLKFHLLGKFQEVISISISSWSLVLVLLVLVLVLLHLRIEGDLKFHLLGKFQEVILERQHVHFRTLGYRMAQLVRLQRLPHRCARIE